MRSRLFDSLKGLAIIGIFMIHAGVNTGILEDGWRTFFKCGAYGVEITYLINAFFLSKKFDSKRVTSKKESILFSLENLIRVLPLYYFLLTIQVISIGISNINIFEIFSHYLFVNAINPEWFTSIYGASGYMSILALMWFIYPAYLKHVRTIGRAVKGVCASVVIFRLVNYLLVFTTDYNIITDAQYFCRGLMAFSCGHLLHLLLKSRQMIFSAIKRWGGTIAIIVGTIMGIMFGQMTSVWILISTSLLIILNFNSSVWLIDNLVLASVGKMIFPIYLVHVYLLTFLFPKLGGDMEALCIIAVVTLGMAILLNPANNFVSDFIKEKLFSIKRGGEDETVS